MKNLVNILNEENFKLALEKAILSTLLFKDLFLDEDFNYFLDYKLEYKLFTSNKTTKAVAKAISKFNEEDKPYDEELIANYIKKFTNLNENEYIDIIASKPISKITFQAYMKNLKKIEQDKKILEVIGYVN